jgi:hypothetical protein
MTTRKQVWKEGVTAGVLGAAGVALWFFVADLIAGLPLHTPGLLGKAMLSVLGHGIEHGVLFNAAAYTVFHVLAFIGVGVLASVLVDVTQRIPQIAAGLLIFFVIFEAGFYFMVVALSKPEILGAIAWYQILPANLVAAAVMGGYFSRRHPEFKPALEHALDGSV